MWPEKPRLLVSFAYIKGAAWPVTYDADVIIDSGAFTAMNSGTRIDLARYADFLTAHADRIRFAFNLDVIGDWKASARNHDRLTALVGDRVRIVPTWHLGSPWPELERICGTVDYASVGGAVPHFNRQNVLMQNLVKAHRIARDHGARLHGLGITSHQALLKLPWASVDSSSWTIPRRRPLTYVADRTGRMRSITSGTRINETDRRTLRAYGLDPNAITQYGYSSSTHVGRDTASARQIAGTLAAVRAYMHVETVRRTKHPGFSLYLAAAPGDDLPRQGWAMGSPFG